MTVNHENYVLGTDDAESVRLGVQHRLWAEYAHAAWERAGIQPGSRVLDVGSGPGYAAMDLAQLVGPTGTLLCVEGSPNFAAECQARVDALGMGGHAEVVQGDVHDIGTLVGDRAGTFEVAYARWVFSFLDSPARAIGAIHGALEQGGRVAIQDYFGYEAIRIAPRSEAFEEGIRGVMRHWGRHGNLDVMQHVPRLLREQGFEMVDFRVCQRIARPGEPMWTWPDIFWPNYIPRVVGDGCLTPEQGEAFMDAWRRASENPDGFILLPPVFDAIARKR